MFSFDVDSGEVHLYGDIGPEWAGMIGAESVKMALDEMGGKDFTMYLSSPGGSVDIGTDVYNAIDRYKGKVTIIVDAIAASMGSYILQAADTRIVATNSKVMVHNPWGLAIGDAAALRKEADVIDKYRDAMIPGYTSATGKTEEEIRSLMDAETWYVGKEIVDAGFADKVLGTSKKAVAIEDVQRWARNAIPEQFAQDFPLRSKARDSIRSMSVADARARLKAVMH